MQNHLPNPTVSVLLRAPGLASSHRVGPILKTRKTGKKTTIGQLFHVTYTQDGGLGAPQEAKSAEGKIFSPLLFYTPSLASFPIKATQLGLTGGSLTDAFGGLILCRQLRANSLCVPGFF